MMFEMTEVRCNRRFFIDASKKVMMFRVTEFLKCKKAYF